MSPPPTNIDGTDITGATIDGQDVQEITVDGNVVFTARNVIQSVAIRPNDDRSFFRSGGDPRGLRFTSQVTFDAIGGEVSSNTAGVTRARITRISDSQIMGQTTFAAKSAGETFTLDLDFNVVSGETYAFNLDANGNGYTQGFNDNGGSPFTSADGNLSIVNGTSGANGLGRGFPSLIKKIGNVGF